MTLFPNVVRQQNTFISGSSEQDSQGYSNISSGVAGLIGNIYNVATKSILAN